MLIDSFLFFNESELAELRIEYLNDVVDFLLLLKLILLIKVKKKTGIFKIY